METSVKLATKVSCSNFTFEKFSFLSKMSRVGQNEYGGVKQVTQKFYLYAKH